MSNKNNKLKSPDTIIGAPMSLSQEFQGYKLENRTIKGMGEVKVKVGKTKYCTGYGYTNTTNKKRAVVGGHVK